MTNDEISALPTVNVLPGGRYSGAKLKSVIRVLRGLLEQGVPSKEIEVSNYLSFKVLFSSMKQLEIEWLAHHCLKYHSSLTGSSKGIKRLLLPKTSLLSPLVTAER